MKTRGLLPVALLSAGLLAFGLQPAPAAGSSSDASAPVAAKLDSGLQILAKVAASGRPVTAQTGASTADGSATVTGGARVVNGDVLVDVYVDGSLADAISDLRALGMRVTASNDRAPQRLVSGWLSATKLLDATALSETRTVRAVHAGVDAADGTDTGSVLSQGDAAHHGPQARATGTTGAGIKVGVISDSMNQVGTGLAGSQSSGNLPAGLTIIADDNQAGVIDEGRAMAEIIYDEAPGITQMYFSTGTVSAAGKATSINNLVAAGVKIIADDIFYLDEPMFQDGQIAQAVDAAKAAGVTYFASAGNRAKQSWEGTLSLSGANEDFDPGAGVDTVQTLGQFTNRSPFVSLQWAEPWGGATTNLALDFYVDGVLVPGQADENNITTGIPNEFEGVTISGTHTLGIGIRRVAGSGTPFMKYIVGGTPTFTIGEYATNSNAINPDAASAAGSLAVAASNWATPATPESYSSRGPSITRLFTTAGVPMAPVVRAKPALDAADAVSTTVPALLTFAGTSAATPSAAGIATLLLSATPTLTADQVRSIMTNPTNAIDCTPTAGQPDLDCGSGFIMADRAVVKAAPTVAGAPAPAAPNGANGWYTTPVSVSWKVTDLGAPATATTGCGASTVVTEGITSLTCSATNLYGTGSATLNLKRDSIAPTKLKAKGLKKVYKHGTKPIKKKIKCKAKDAGSGIASCKIKGLKTSPGKHKVTVIATDNAGLVTTKKFKYEIL